MQQTQLVSPSPNNAQPFIPQTQSLYLPNTNNQSHLRSSQFLPQAINNQNAFQFANSYSQSPIIANDAYSHSQYNANTANAFTNGSNFAINQSSLRQTRDSKYKNKYSFKRNPANNSVGPLASSFNNTDANASLRVSQDLFNEATQYKAIINKQVFVLAHIRDIALNRRMAFDIAATHSADSIREINALTEIYNLTLVNLNTGVKPLQFVEEVQLPPPIQAQIQPIPQIQNGSTFSRSYQPIFKQQVVPYASQQNISSQVVVNSRPQVINFSQTQKQSQSTFVAFSQPQQVKVEQRPTIYQQIYEVPASVLPPVEPIESYKQKEFNRYEAYQGTFEEQKVVQPTEAFKFQTYKTSYNPSSYETTTYQSYKLDFKPSYLPQAELTSYKAGSGNTLNINTSTQDKNNSYESVEVRELKLKIQQLEEEKSVLIDKIRSYEKSNNFQNLNNNQTIENCQQEIAKLKAQIAELTVIYNNNGKPNETEVSELKKSINILEETIKQYEQQLIQAQNHIIFLQNNQSGEDVENYKTEIKYLRETIAKYTEHIEQMDIERQKLTQEAHDANQYIQTLQNHIQTNPAQANGVSYQIYQNLIIQYGRKELQVIILLEEINRLNVLSSQLREHLEKAEEYIINLQQGKQNAGFEGELAALKTQHHRTLNLIVQYEERLSQINEQNKSLKSKALSKPLETHTKVGSAPQACFMDHQQYQHLLDQIKCREKQSIVLRQEIDKLNDQYIETRKHLESAEEFIIHLQEKQSNQREDQAKLIEQQQSIINVLQTTLKSQQFEKEQLRKRSLSFTAEYEDMQYRYKNALDELSKRYDQLLQERNSLISKLSDNQTHAKITSTGPIISESEVDHLRESLNNLNIQLFESKEHLISAENYIEQNAKTWEEASSFKEKHDQLQSFVAIINNDLQSTKRQNEELGSRLQSLEGLVADVDRLRTENEQLTIVIRQKDNSDVSTSLKQIDEVQEALNNYTHLYQESQMRVKQLEEEKERLVAKAEQLEEYLTRAESFIIEQEATNKQNEKSVKDLSEQLLKAEEHIFTLETEYNSILKQKDEYQSLSRAEFERANELHDALQKAETHIFEIEAKVLKK